MIAKANELNKKLKQVDEVKEYITIKEKIKKDSQILALLDKISKTQNLMNQALKENKQNTYLLYRKELDNLKKLFYENPTIVNYLNLKNDVYNLIEQLLQIIGE